MNAKFIFTNEDGYILLSFTFIICSHIKVYYYFLSIIMRLNIALEHTVLNSLTAKLNGLLTKLYQLIFVRHHFGAVHRYTSRHATVYLLRV
jgi:hypothetical protein